MRALVCCVLLLADALFVNYTWTPPQLPTTTLAAGARSSSVFMGVDVFGRGSYGGGGFGVGLALEAAAAAGLSAALFAPGWVHENLDKAHFHELQDKWWGQVSWRRGGGGAFVWWGGAGRLGKGGSGCGDREVREGERGRGGGVCGGGGERTWLSHSFISCKVSDGGRQAVM
jgi:hypothetical protein